MAETGEGTEALLGIMASVKGQNAVSLYRSLPSLRAKHWKMKVQNKRPKEIQRLSGQRKNKGKKENTPTVTYQFLKELRCCVCANVGACVPECTGTCMHTLLTCSLTSRKRCLILVGSKHFPVEFLKSRRYATFKKKKKCASVKEWCNHQSSTRLLPWGLWELSILIPKGLFSVEERIQRTKAGKLSEVKVL